MNTLIIYDNSGYIISTMGGAIREPQGGVQFIWTVIPTGKQIKYTDGIGVDVSLTPNVAILEDIPLTEIEVANKRILNTENMLNALMMM